MDRSVPEPPDSPANAGEAGGRSPSSVERVILDRLGWVIEPNENASDLLVNRALFLRAARRALTEGLATEVDLVRVGRRAGFKLDGIRTRQMNTMRFPLGIEVSIADRFNNSASGTIVESHADSLTIRLRRGPAAFPAGTQLDVVCSDDSGFYRFQSGVQKVSGRTLFLTHAGEVMSAQRRRYRRYFASLPVAVRSVAANAVVRTRTLDLSIGGVTVRNRRRVLALSDTVTIAFHADSGAYDANARVVRLSRGGRIAHLRFEALAERDRHGLFRLMVDRGRR